jgi:DNA-binding NarL/FixJ family response regulator
VLLGEEDVRADRLTFRQRTILEHVARGQTDAEIAADLRIAPATVNKHLEQIYARLGVHTRTAAAAIVK